ncbi:hypothetical protein B0H15DRAFT_943589 [Mycena belliarum]|uniref:Uncharacterized protein n=1 Tax=Mycena belliarum TaxID=1033014 RepID=A0AAD6Y0K7_9AGAR|nr:hypothetical protein B0H15DRAFT_943589 [Mycena belliae]
MPALQVNCRTGCVDSRHARLVWHADGVQVNLRRLRIRCAHAHTPHSISTRACAAFALEAGRSHSRRTAVPTPVTYSSRAATGRAGSAQCIGMRRGGAAGGRDRSAADAADAPRAARVSAGRCARAALGADVPAPPPPPALARYQPFPSPPPPPPCAVAHFAAYGPARANHLPRAQCGQVLAHITVIGASLVPASTPLAAPRQDLPHDARPPRARSASPARCPRAKCLQVAQGTLSANLRARGRTAARPSELGDTRLARELAPELLQSLGPNYGGRFVRAAARSPQTGKRSGTWHHSSRWARSGQVALWCPPTETASWHVSVACSIFNFRTVEYNIRCLRK